MHTHTLACCHKWLVAIILLACLPVSTHIAENTIDVVSQFGQVCRITCACIHKCIAFESWKCLLWSSWTISTGIIYKHAHYITSKLRLCYCGGRWESVFYRSSIIWKKTGAQNLVNFPQMFYLWVLWLALTRVYRQVTNM